MNPGDLKYRRNPYNFSLPVNDPSLLSGRGAQLEDIGYYLNDAQESERPVSLAILGDRASGKTSLLNVLDQRARDRGFLVARIDLNEGDVSSTLAFFHKVFHFLFSAAIDCEKPDGSGYVFEGRRGETAETYYSMITTFSIPESKLFCPFNFPIFYARAMAAGADQVAVPEDFLRQDFELIAASVDRPVALLFDECDVLSKNRILLQMMRNIFMHLKRFLLVLTGTSSLLERVDDVFSPIIRQFKKIEVGPFSDVKQTTDCLRRPLEAAKDLQPAEILAFDDRALLKDIHDFTGGKPYEIQLLGHFMFKRVQQAKDKTMLLSADVLDTVRTELGTGNDLASRPIFVRLRAYDRDALRDLAAFLQGERFMTFDDLALASTLPPPGRDSTPYDVRDLFDRFVADGMLKVTGKTYEFAGDELDRIYAKYFARARGVLLPSTGRPADFVINQRLLAYFFSTQKGSRFNFLNGSSILTGTEALIGLLSGKWNEAMDELSQGVIDDVYETAQDAQEGDPPKATVVSVRLTHMQLDSRMCAVIDPEDKQRLTDALRLLRDRVEPLGASLQHSCETVDLVGRYETAALVASNASSDVREQAASYHNQRVYNSYIASHDGTTALAEAKIGAIFETQASLLNYGYLLLQNGDLKTSEHFLLRATSPKTPEGSIAYYDLGIIKLLSGSYRAALDLFREALSSGSDMTAQAGALNEVSIGSNNEVVLTERIHPNINELTVRAVEVTSKLVGEVS